MGESTHVRRAKNKRAFEDVLEAYESMKYRSSISAMDDSKETRTAVNPAKPSNSDFVCDVENTILSIVKTKELLTKIINAYIMGSEELSKSRSNSYEQRIGHLFIIRSIWPINRYFIAVRRTNDKKA